MYKSVELFLDNFHAPVYAGRCERSKVGNLSRPRSLETTLLSSCFPLRCFAPPCEYFPDASPDSMFV